ncbi:MAG: twin-arginine translocase subunit TatC [Deltaproteobacteria bacterium]|jgi:sec-independent protein translocase protein TatC|nr:twin-arginine translocase subunit TatC [Deltaproteobacteria bacterium]
MAKPPSGNEPAGPGCSPPSAPGSPAAGSPEAPADSAAPAGGGAAAGEAAGPAEKELTFLDHLTELRSRLIKGLIAVVPAVLIAYEFSGRILGFLSAPLMALLPPGQGLVAMALPDTFLIHMKIALWGGVFVSAPFWLYQLWAFVAPGLYRKEKRAALKLTAAAFLLLTGGAAFAYYVVLPAGFRFFLGFAAGEVTVLPAISGYLSLVMTLLFAFGLAFQLPLLLLFLAATGLVDSGKLSRFRRFAILIIAVLAAFLTPPDVISQIFMAIPLILLYELSLFLIRGREKAAAAAGAKEVKAADAARGGKAAAGAKEGKDAAGAKEGKAAARAKDGKAAAGAKDGKATGGDKDGKAAGGVKDGKAD